MSQRRSKPSTTIGTEEEIVKKKPTRGEFSNYGDWLVAVYSSQGEDIELVAITSSESEDT